MTASANALHRYRLLQENDKLEFEIGPSIDGRDLRNMDEAGHGCRHGNTADFHYWIYAAVHSQKRIFLTSAVFELALRPAAHGPGRAISLTVSI